MLAAILNPIVYLHVVHVWGVWGACGCDLEQLVHGGGARHVLLVLRGEVQRVQQHGQRARLGARQHAHAAPHARAQRHQPQQRRAQRARRAHALDGRQPLQHHLDAACERPYTTLIKYLRRDQDTSDFKTLCFGTKEVKTVTHYKHEKLSTQARLKTVLV